MDERYRSSLEDFEALREDALFGIGSDDLPDRAVCTSATRIPQIDNLVFAQSRLR